jgi:hypothetical protein
MAQVQSNRARTDVLGNRSGGTMENRANEVTMTGTKQSAPVAGRGFSPIWSALVALAMALDAGAVTARLAAGPRFDGLLIFAAVCAAVFLAVRLLVQNRITPEPAGQPASEPLKELFDSAGPMVATIGLDGR